MSFLKLILKNPFRKRSSAILAIIGIGIGITTIIALGAITDSMVTSLEDTIHAGGADFTISGKDSGRTAYGTNTIDANWTNKINAINGVESAYPIYVIQATTSNNPYFTLIGISPNGIKSADLSVTNGTLFKDNTNEIILGKVSAENNNLSIGDSLIINDETFKVSGIYETGNANNDGAAYTSMSTVQRLMNETNQVSNIYVKVNKDSDAKKVADNINTTYGTDINVVSDITQMGQMADMINMLKSASFAISILAIIVGGLGIINTMLMSVLDRTREIGVLKAVGWSNKKVIEMILGESLVITSIATVLGMILGVVFVEILGSVIGFSGVYTLNTFLEAIIVAFTVGIIGGVYPAYKAVKLPPTEALKYE